MSDIIGIVGAGTMGNGIAQTAARAGYEVVMCDIKQEFVDRGVAAVSSAAANPAAARKMMAVGPVFGSGRRRGVGMDASSPLTLLPGLRHATAPRTDVR